jgi:hypothetical protein
MILVLKMIGPTKISDEVCYLLLDPREHSSRLTPLAFITKCCKGCVYLNDGISDLKDVDRVEKCGKCITKIIEPAYVRGEPFTFNRESGRTSLSQMGQYPLQLEIQA